MNKYKVFYLLLIVLIIITLTSCGNYDLLDTEYKFDYALVLFPGDTEATKIQIKQWTDYDGEQLQITATDGTIYVVNSVNCILVKEN